MCGWGVDGDRRAVGGRDSTARPCVTGSVAVQVGDPHRFVHGIATVRRHRIAARLSDVPRTGEGRRVSRVLLGTAIQLCLAEVERECGKADQHDKCQRKQNQGLASIARAVNG